jgi:SAM-dependent methyltransferase
VRVPPSWLAHPLTRGIEIDDPRTTALRREIVRSKPFLRRVYLEWYRLVRDCLPPFPGEVLELGSGAGFLREVIPGALTSEVFPTPGVDLVVDAHCLPFRDRSLRAVAMFDVLHHLSDLRRFFAEAARCVRPGGVITAVEPWVTVWSGFVYRRFHHEPFVPEASDWAFPASGPLSASNQALPWIVLERDRRMFEREFPCWRVARVTPLMPLRYLASGGVGLRVSAPAWSYGLFVGLERLLAPFMRQLAMFAHVVLERVDRGDDRDLPMGALWDSRQKNVRSSS